MIHNIRKYKCLFKKKQNGQILILVLVFFLLGSLMLVPLLSFMATGLKTNRVYEDKTNDLYAADSGIEDGKWKIEYNKLNEDYPYYDFTHSYTYYISESEDDEIGEDINGNRVEVTIQNIWIPEGYIDKPSVNEAEDIIDDKKLVVTGTTSATGISVENPTNPSETIQISQYTIKIVYDYIKDEDIYAFTVDKIGVWLPRGYEYFSDSEQDYEGSPIFSELEGLDEPYRSVPQTFNSNSNQMVVWNFDTNPTFALFPASVLTTSSTMTLEFSFFFKPLGDINSKPDAVAWITNTDDSVFSWNANIKVYRIESEAGGTIAEAYISKDELAVPSSAVAGDYYATGNTLMRNAHSDDGHIRDTWLHTDASINLNSSNAVIDTKEDESDNGIPADADVSLAYLYWTSWYNENSKTLISPLNPENCNNVDDWNKGSNWDTKGSTNKYFNSHYSSGASSSRNLTLKNEIDLSTYANSKVMVSWKQWMDELSTTYTAIFSDACSNFDNWDRSADTSGSQTRVPTADGDIDGTWTPTPSSGSVTLRPNGDRSYSGTWNYTSNMYTYVDETTTDGDTTYLRVGTTPGYALFSFDTPTIPANATINNITVSYVARDDGSGSSNNLSAALNVGENNYLTTDSGANPSSTYPGSPRSFVFTTNPKTTHSWTVAQITGSDTNNSLRGFGINSSDANPRIRITQVYATVNYTLPLYATVDETTADDSDYFTGTTNGGGYCLFNFSNFDIPTSASITDLTIYYRTQDVTIGGNNVGASIKVDGSRYNNIATSNDPSASWTTYSSEFTTNPKTGSAWTVADLNGSGSRPLEQFGVYSNDLDPDIRVSMIYAEVNYTSNGSLWTATFGEFRGQGSSSTTSDRRMLTMKNSLDLSDYDSGTIGVSWDQDTNNDVDESDHLYYAFYNGSWSNNYEAFHDDDPESPFSVIIPDQYLTSNFKMRFYFDFNNSNEYVYIDDIEIVHYNSGYSAADGLNFSFSGDDGITWCSDFRAFRYGDDGLDTSKPTSNNFFYTVPLDYLTDDFLIRFTLVGCEDDGEAVNVDDITLCVMEPDTTAVFKIGGQQVYLDDEGKPQEGFQEITADRAEVILNITSGESMGYSYSCFKDVTALVREFTKVNEGEEDEHSPGIATYTVGDVGGTLGIDGGDYQLAHAGWSLIIVYTSTETEGHQLYLFDRFTYADDYSDLDFNNDGNPGGDISGFIVPERIEKENGELEIDVAKLTVFVGEGDDWITGDFIAFQSPESYWDGTYEPEDIPDSYKLWDGITTDDNISGNPENVWNGESLLFTADGVDIDTFNITWDSGALSEGDTKAHVDIYTDQDNWNLVYIILSFRSVTTTGGALSYLINGD